MKKTATVMPSKAMPKAMSTPKMPKTSGKPMPTGFSTKGQC